MRRARSAAALLAAALLGSAVACAEDADGPQACTEEARASVQVSVVEGGGVPLPGATVTWRVDGGGPQPAECADPALPRGACAEFVAGWEVAGTIRVEAVLAGHEGAGATVLVPMDDVGCHVVTQRVVLTLKRL